MAGSNGDTFGRGNQADGLRLLYINPFLGRYDFWTGERGRQFVTELGRHGAQVETLTSVLDGPAPAAADTGGLAGWAKQVLRQRIATERAMFLVELLLIIRGLRRTVRQSWGAWRRRRQLQVDAVLARAFEYDWSAWIVARILDAPLILESHSVFFVERRLRGRRRSALWQWFEIQQWQRCQRIWVNTSELKDKIVEHGISAERVCVIPFGLKLDAYSATPHAHGTGDVGIIFVGSFYTWHGAEVLLRAVARAREQTDNIAKLVMVGDGMTRSNCEELARDLGISDLVEFTGWLPHEDVVARIHDADIAVAPYLKVEPFYFEPVKVLEYMAEGAAIVGSAQGCVPDLLDRGAIGRLVPPGDVDALAREIVDLSGDAATRAKLGAASRRKFEANHTMQVTASRVSALLNDVVRSAPATDTSLSVDGAPGRSEI